MAKLTKLNVARHQLGTALDLFIRDRDPIAVQCLACGGGELIEKIASFADIRTLSTHMLETVPELDVGKLRNLQRQYWNAFKHIEDRGGKPRDDDDILAAFDDTKNDTALFVGWWDYYAVTGKLPLPVQVFQIWWYALNQEKLAPKVQSGHHSENIARDFLVRSHREEAKTQARCGKISRRRRDTQRSSNRGEPSLLPFQRFREGSQRRGSAMKRIYVALLGALPLSAVGAQQPTTITLSCSGTSKCMMAGDDIKPDPIPTIGMIVNFAERTVTFNSYRIPIERTDSTMVLFHGDHAMSYGGV